MTTGQCILNRDGQLFYHPNFFIPQYFDLLEKEIPWVQNKIKIYGKIHLEPRLSAWYGPAYSYSSIKWPDQKMPAMLQDMATRLEKLCEFPFNAVLLNYYRDGKDAMGWHRDNEKEIDQSLIASVSLGAERTFKLRHRGDGEKLDLSLENGSLLVMKDLQEHWEHHLPRSKKIKTPRINLTFRRIKTT